MYSRLNLIVCVVIASINRWELGLGLPLARKASRRTVRTESRFSVLPWLAQHSADPQQQAAAGQGAPVRRKKKVKIISSVTFARWFVENNFVTRLHDVRQLILRFQNWKWKKNNNKWIEKISNHEKNVEFHHSIIDQMQRWMVKKQKSNNNGSTLFDSRLLRALVRERKESYTKNNEPNFGSNWLTL